MSLHLRDFICNIDNERYIGNIKKVKAETNLMINGSKGNYTGEVKEINGITCAHGKGIFVSESGTKITGTFS